MSEKNLVALLIILLPVLSSGLSNQNKESELIRKLLENYNILARPVLKSSDVVEVELQFTILKILHVNEKAQMITTNIWLKTSWNDSFLVWDPENYDNIKAIRIPTDRIWHPDLTHYNAVEGEQMNNAGSRNAVITNNGVAVYVPSMILRSSCLMDITWFPFDTQNCEVDFGSWTYSGFELDVKIMPVDLSNYAVNGEWDLLEATTTRKVMMYACCSEPYINSKLAIRLKRKSLYYFFNLIVPGTLIGFLAILGFTLPPDSGEKLTLGVTVLFSLIMFLNIISQSMPANADKIPLLGTYFTCIMFTIASSVISTIVINLSQRTIGVPNEISGRCRTILFERIPRILRMCPLKSRTTEPHGTKVCAENKSDDLTNDVKEMDYFLDERYSAKRITIMTEWKFVANVVDRLCLIASLIFTLVASVVLVSST